LGFLVVVNSNVNNKKMYEQKHKHEHKNEYVEAVNAGSEHWRNPPVACSKSVNGKTASGAKYNQSQLNRLTDHWYLTNMNMDKDMDTDVDKNKDKARCVIMSSLSHHQANVEISVRSQIHYGVSVKSHHGPNSIPEPYQRMRPCT
jgi:hypothetical protein